MDLLLEKLLILASLQISFISLIILKILSLKSFLKLKRAYAVPKDMSTGIFWDSNDSVREIIIEPQDHFRLMVDDFCREISGRKHTRNFEDDLLEQARVMEAARLSHKEERIVNISEVG